MKSKSQEKKAISPLIQEIKAKAATLGINTNVGLAKRAGVDPSVTWRLLNGGTQISINNIYKILKSLNLINSHQEADDPYQVAEALRAYDAGDNHPLIEQLENFRELMREYKRKAQYYQDKFENLNTFYHDQTPHANPAWGDGRHQKKSTE